MQPWVQRPSLLQARLPSASGRRNYHGLVRVPPADLDPEPASVEESVEKLLALGGLLRRGRRDRPPSPGRAELLLRFPLLLSYLHDHQAEMAQAGLRRGEWVAAAQLFMELHDLCRDEASPQAQERLSLLEAALGAFHLRAATCVHRRCGGDPAALCAVVPIRR